MRRLIVPLALSISCVGGLPAQRPAWFHAPIFLESLKADMELVGDVDRDGDLDVIAFLSPSSSGARTSFTPMLNDGSGNLTAGTAVSLPSQAGTATHFADVDGDTWGDVLVSTLTTSTLGAGILVYPGKAKGQFGAPLHISLPGNVGSLRSGHINKDGILDIFVAHGSATLASSEVAWYPGTKTRVFKVGPRALVPSVRVVGKFAILDTNADGIDDYAVGETPGLTSTVSLFQTTATGFKSGPVMNVAARWLYNLVASDIDKDGDHDLVTSFGGTNPVDIMTMVNSGGGVWQASGVQGFSNISTGQLFVGDWDGDGVEDLVMRGYASGATILRNHTVSYFKNSGTGVYTRVYSVLHRGPRTANFGAGLFDLDRDGSLDLVDSRLLFFGDGTFDPPFVGFARYTPMDWDADGDLDSFSDPIQINDGRGVYTSIPRGWPTPPASTVYGSPIAAGDLDGDGLNDLIVSHVRIIFPRTYQFLEMRRLEQKGDGTFVDAGAAAPPAAAMMPGVFADVDGDGDRDYLDVAGVWLNNGAGFFTQTGPSFQSYRPIAVGDINGDGAEDVLAAFTGNGTSLAVLYRTGKAKFSLSVLFASTQSGIDVTSGVIADLDNDGDLDIVGRDVPRGAPPRTLVFENQAGKLAAPLVIGLPGFCSAGDIDGDGRTDLVIDDGRISRVLRRKAAGLVYDAPVAFIIGGVRHLVDVDQDGDLDVATPSFVRNRRFEGSSAGSRRQYGAAMAGTGGRRPIASITGPIRVGETPKLRLRHAVGGGVAYLLVGAVESNRPSLVIPGMTVYTSPIVALYWFGLSGAAGKPGVGELDLPVKIPAGIGGARAFFQFLVADTGGSNGISSHTGGVEVLIGK